MNRILSVTILVGFLSLVAFVTSITAGDFQCPTFAGSQTNELSPGVCKFGPVQNAVYDVVPSGFTGDYWRSSDQISVYNVPAGTSIATVEVTFKATWLQSTATGCPIFAGYPTQQASVDVCFFGPQGPVSDLVPTGFYATYKSYPSGWTQNATSGTRITTTQATFTKVITPTSTPSVRAYLPLFYNGFKVITDPIVLLLVKDQNRQQLVSCVLTTDGRAYICSTPIAGKGGTTITWTHPGNGDVLHYWTGFSPPINASSCVISESDDGSTRAVVCSSAGATFIADRVTYIQRVHQ